MTLSASTRGREPVTAALRAALVVGALAATAPALHAQQLVANQVNQLKQLSIEQLADVMVTSVTRAPQPLSRSAAAAAVLTSDQITSSGAMNVPEAIRYVPGINVAQLTASQWAVSSRGFASANSPDLLVLSDGRS